MKDLHSISNSWCTPIDLFEVLNKGGEYLGVKFEGFNFDIDLCATKENSKCVLFMDDYLNNRVYLRKTDKTIYVKFKLHEGNWLDCAFMNPPYSNPKPFIEKAWEDAKYCKIVCLVKVDPSTKWWRIFFDYSLQKCRPGADIKYFPKRIKFDPPPQLIDNGSVYKIHNRWVQKCKNCTGSGSYEFRSPYSALLDEHCIECAKCKGKGYTELSGPSFASCLIIMDRRRSVLC